MNNPIMMDDNQLLRYSRQIFLPEIEVAGQQKLLQSRALIVGVGGLGSPVSMYLAAAGVGHLYLADGDEVDLSNLQRQIVHDTVHTGQSKVLSAKARLNALNPEITVTTIIEHLTPDNLDSYVNDVDVVVDCCDNFATRFALNAASVRLKKPLISGAAIHFSGQVSVFIPTQADSPCYRCLYSDEGEQPARCSELGILSPLPGVIGSLQAVETIKVLLGIGESLCGQLLFINALTMQWRTIRLKKDPACPVCANQSVNN